MQRRLALIVPLLIVSIAAIRPAEKGDPLVLHVAPDDWGNAPAANVEAVLRSAASAILQYLPDHGLDPIHVAGNEGPIVYYQRAEDGGYQVRLNTRDTYWAQYSFQFAHELGHILCGYDNIKSGNHFLEEALCEAASLFALRQMAVMWQTDPPYANWTSYAPRLAEYAQERMDAARLPEERTLAAWYEEHAQYLRENSTDREKNLLIATALLPLFEKDPRNGWAAVRTLNTAEPGTPQPFDQHLREAIAPFDRGEQGDPLLLAGITGQLVDLERPDPALRQDQLAVIPSVVVAGLAKLDVHPRQSPQFGGLVDPSAAVHTHIHLLDRDEIRVGCVDDPGDALDIHNVIRPPAVVDVVAHHPQDRRPVRGRGGRIRDTPRTHWRNQYSQHQQREDSLYHAFTLPADRPFGCAVGGGGSVSR